jgi:taurine dioxygenase
MAIAIKDLEAALGAEVADIDLSKPLPRADIDAIEAAWRERLVVVFNGQTLSDPQLIAFSKNFGELDPPGPNPYGVPFNKEHPELNVISNVVESGK